MTARSQCGPSTRWNVTWSVKGGEPWHSYDEGEPRGQDAQGSWAGSEGQTVRDATSARTEGRQVHADRKLELGDQGLGEGMKSQCFLGTERRFGEMESSGDGRR